MMPYEFLAKNLQRACVLQMYLTEPTRKPVVYLDDEHAGATSFFLARGVPCEHLVPVTWSSEDAARIEDRTKVRCVAASIDEHVFALADDSCSVVWLDYTCRTVCDRVIRRCLDVAPYVSVTLSTRGRSRAETLAEIRNVSKRCGVLFECPAFYKGKSDVENMVRFAIGRRPVETTEATAKPTAKAAPKSPVHSAGDKVYVKWGSKTWLTGTVVSDKGGRVRVLFDCDHVAKWVPESLVFWNTDTPTPVQLDEVVGATLRVPQAWWWRVVGRTGVKDVKRFGKRYALHVAKRYRGQNRYAVSAISKATGKPKTATERVTLTYEQIACFA